MEKKEPITLRLQLDGDGDLTDQVKRGKKTKPDRRNNNGGERKWYKERMERMNGRKERYISKELNGTERAAKFQVEVEGEEIKGTPTDCLREDPEGKKRRLKSERKKAKELSKIAG